jgi:hypothetical protein
VRGDASDVVAVDGFVWLEQEDVARSERFGHELGERQILQALVFA